MSRYFYNIIDDAVNYDNKERMAEMYALRYEDMRDWCFEQMNQMSIPYEFAKYVLDDLFADKSDFNRELYVYMQESCEPEPEDEEEDGEESE